MLMTRPRPPPPGRAVGVRRRPRPIAAAAPPPGAGAARPNGSLISGSLGRLSMARAILSTTVLIALKTALTRSRRPRKRPETTPMTRVTAAWNAVNGPTRRAVSVDQIERRAPMAVRMIAPTALKTEPTTAWKALNGPARRALSVFQIGRMIVFTNHWTMVATARKARTARPYQMRMGRRRIGASRWKMPTTVAITRWITDRTAWKTWVTIRRNVSDRCQSRTMAATRATMAMITIPMGFAARAAFRSHWAAAMIWVRAAQIVAMVL